MNASMITEVSLAEFAEAMAAEFDFLRSDYRLDGPFVWDFADTNYAAFEGPDLATWTWCGKRDDDVWTMIERLDLGRKIPLDTLAMLRRDDRYPPATGMNWERDEFLRRLELEASMLRDHLPATMGEAGTALLAEEGSELSPDAESVDSPHGAFVRRCSERLRFLEDAGFRRDLTAMGTGLLYRRGEQGIRVILVATACEHEDDDEPTVEAEVYESPDGVVPPFMLGTEEIELPDREGPFSLPYLERSLAIVEHELRRRFA